MRCKRKYTFIICRQNSCHTGSELLHKVQIFEHTHQLAISRHRATAEEIILRQAQGKVQAINEQLIELQQELLDKVSKRQNYDDIADEIFKLREKKEKTNIDTSARDEQIGRITELQDFIKQQSTELTEFNENLARRWIKKITIYDDKYTVEFKSGVSVDIEG